MKIDRENLLQKLESVLPGLAKRELLQQSSCFAFTGKKVMTFNEEVACSQDFDTPFVGAIVAMPMISILRNLTETTVEIFEESKEGKGTKIIIKGKNKRARLAIESEIELPIDAVETPGEWKTLPEGFAEAISMVHSCASKDITRFGLTCVHITPKWVEAGSDDQIARYKIQTPIEESFLVPAKALKNMMSLDMKEISETSNWVHFQNEDGLVFSCRRYLEPFHNLSKIFKVKGQTIVLPKGLVEAAKNASIFSDESAMTDLIKITLKPNKLIIFGKGVTGDYKEGKKIKYDGKTFSFKISPGLLMRLVKDYNECILSPTRLKIKIGKFKYVTLLSIA